MSLPIRSLSGRFLLTFLFFLCLSCKSVPPEGEAGRPLPEPYREEPGVPAPDPAISPAEAEAEVLPEEELPSEFAPVEPPVRGAPEYGELPEPEADLAEANLPDFYPWEETGIGTLPEPVPPEAGLIPGSEPVSEPESEPLIEPEPVPEAAPEPALPPEPVPPAALPAPVSEPVPPPVVPAPSSELPPPSPEPPPSAEPVPPPEVPIPGPPPVPPRNPRPVEPLPPPAAVRENPPVPVNPIPDLPPRFPPAVLQPPVEPETDLAFSRVIRAAVGQLVEIPFRGTGWVFLGELGARRGIAYGSRRLDPEGQSFIFRAEEPGDYVLKFYKQDFIRDFILNDYVRVIIAEPPASGGTAVNPPVDRGRVIAEPRWPFLPGEAPASGDRDAELSIGTGVPPEDNPSPELRPPEPVRGPDTVPEREAPPAPAALPPAAETRPPEAGSSPDEYISRAREEYDAGRIVSALSILDQFREKYPAGSDEAWWLYGQLLEANGPRRDIRSALDYYRRLIREYPQSTRFDEARRRIAYLERYYFNIQ